MTSRLRSYLKAQQARFKVLIDTAETNLGNAGLNTVHKDWIKKILDAIKVSEYYKGWDAIPDNGYWIVAVASFTNDVVMNENKVIRWVGDNVAKIAY